MVALHVHSSFARSKNRLTRALYHIGKTRVDIKKEWKFLDELKNLNYMQEERRYIENNKDTQNDTVHDSSTSNTTRRRRSRARNVKSEEGEIGNPLQILKLRLTKGEMTKNEYNELYNAIS
jgi:hypothetical protein